MSARSNALSARKPLPLVAVVAAGVLLHAYTMLVAAARPIGVFHLALFAWSCLPYIVAALLPRSHVAPGTAAGFALGALLGDLYMHYSVFVAPRGSTAALGLLVMPLWNLLLLGPLGALAARALARLRRDRGARHESRVPSASRPSCGAAGDVWRWQADEGLAVKAGSTRRTSLRRGKGRAAPDRRRVPTRSRAAEPGRRSAARYGRHGSGLIPSTRGDTPV
jgi:hypothetical protein